MTFGNTTQNVTTLQSVYVGPR